ncbi:MAG: serine hydrolase domain-containing protein [Planctomycetota bacterium]
MAQAARGDWRLGALRVAAGALLLAAAAPAQDLEAAVAAAVDRAAPDLWGAVLVATDGEARAVVCRGAQDRAAGAPVDRNSLFDLGTLSDRVTALAALRLCAQKRWKIDDPVGRRLPGWPDDKASITWRHLIRHSAALPAAIAYDGDAGARRTAIAALARAPLDGVPGAAFRWSPAHSTLLALLLEQCGGKDFEDVVRTRTLQPAGMRGACFVGQGRVDAARLTARRRPDGTLAPVDDLPWDWSQKGGRGLLASVDDLSALAAALCGSRLLDADDRAVLLQPFDAGNALQVQTVVRSGVTWIQLHGAATGYRARLLLQLDARAWIVLLTDECDLDPLELAITAAVAPALPAAVVGADAAAPSGAAIPVPVPAPAPPPSRDAGASAAVGDDDLLRFVGVFELPTGGRFEVRRRGDGRELELAGIGLVASARLAHGRWPLEGLDRALRLFEDRGMAGLEPLLFGRDDAPSSCFANGGALAAARRVMAEVRARVGSGAELQFVGSQVQPQKVSWLRVRGLDGTAWVRVGWTRDGEIGTIVEWPQGAPFRAELRVERPDWAVGRAGDVPLTLSVEGRGASRVLVFEDAAGVVACPWVGDLR